MRIVSGEAMTIEGHVARLTRFSQVFVPTTSAPADSLRPPWRLSRAKAATRLVLPGAVGHHDSATERTWSDFVASMPSCTAPSMDSSNWRWTRRFEAVESFAEP